MDAPRGIGRFTLVPAVRGRPLVPGRYRLAVSALDRSGQRVGPRTARFVVTR